MSAVIACIVLDIRWIGVCFCDDLGAGTDTGGQLRAVRRRSSLCSLLALRDHLPADLQHLLCTVDGEETIVVVLFCKLIY